MRTLSTRLKAILGVLVLTTTAFMAVTITHPGKAEAADCLADQQQFSKPSGGTRYPSSGYLKTTSKCQDINLKANLWYDSGDTARAIKVCFKTAGCQDHWTNVYRYDWYEIATNVKDGTEYYFKFYTTGKWYGIVAD